MAEIRDHALLLRRIPYSETSFICHFLTPEYGRVSLMAKGARRAKSTFRAALAPLYPLSITWREGRTGMGTLTDIHRGSALLDEQQSLAGLELLSIASGLFQEGDPHGYGELLQAIHMLGKRHEIEAVCASAWLLLHEAGWIGDLSHCWHCGEDVDDAQAMHWKSSQLLCQSCGGGNSISAGLRRGILGVLQHDHVRLSVGDAMQWRRMIALVLREHGVKVPESFR
ncbi:MAG: DNA repair protein RecO [Mariprofundaceae bacterium]|nr:DNA repair protein RecO [Mariprofundaceae bacterium]